MVLKDYIFWKQQFWNFDNMVSFPSGGCVDDVVDNQINYQGFQFNVYYIECHRCTVRCFIKGERVC